MRRADRLFALVQLIRGRRLSTAAWLAGRLEVSARTVYRDVADLQVQGVPIEGEAGVGYRLGKGFDMPPLMFTADEARALAIATRIAQQWLDPALALAAGDAMSRVMSVLPLAVRSEVDRMPMLVPLVGLTPETGVLLQQLREATQSRTVLQIGYSDASEQRSTRQVWPRGCCFWPGRLEAARQRPRMLVCANCSGGSLTARPWQLYKILSNRSCRSLCSRRFSRLTASTTPPG